MNWNPWRHIRLAGAVIVIVAFFINSFPLTLLGLTVQYVGTIAGLDRVERLIEKLLPTEEEN